MSEAEDKTSALLASLWVRIRPIVEERFTTLDGAAAAASNGSLTDDVRKEAQSSAHKLAGSLGMYGYDEGTRIARKLEVLLDDGAVEPAQLTALVGELRASVFPEG